MKSKCGAAGAGSLVGLTSAHVIAGVRHFRLAAPPLLHTGAKNSSRSRICSHYAAKARLAHGRLSIVDTNHSWVAEGRRTAFERLDDVAIVGGSLRTMLSNLAPVEAGIPQPQAMLPEGCDGKIVEDWDVIQPIPKVSANKNTMF